MQPGDEAASAGPAEIDILRRAALNLPDGDLMRFEHLPRPEPAMQQMGPDRAGFGNDDPNSDGNLINIDEESRVVEHLNREVVATSYVLTLNINNK